MKKTLLFGVCALSVITGHSQCTVTFPDTAYCSYYDSSVVLSVDTAGGYWMGPGIVDSVNGLFIPSMAGTGNIVIYYNDTNGGGLYNVDTGGTYNPLPGTGTTVSLSDDQLSGALPIGFNFRFFGITYNQFYISSNGFISFTSGVSNGCCGGQLLPNNGNPYNLIAFCWDDMYPPGNGSIDYFTTGTAPNRILVMNYRDIPFCCNSTPVVSTQVLLYETSNKIEIHTLYANGINPGTMGIENLTADTAYLYPGRNSSSWSTANDYVAFTPGFSCAGSVFIDPVPTAPVITPSGPTTFCEGGSVLLTSNILTGITWSNGDTLFYTTADNTGSYSAYVFDDYGCNNKSNTVNVVEVPAANAGLDGSANICSADSAVDLFALLNGTPDTSGYWVDNGNTGNLSGNIFNAQASGNGFYQFTYVVSGTQPCPDATSTITLMVSECTGVSEKNNGMGVSVYPNPANGMTWVNLNLSNSGNFSLSLYNAYGAVVWSEDMHFEAGNNKTGLDLSTLPSGIYQLRIKGQDAMVAKIIEKL